MIIWKYSSPPSPPRRSLLL